MKIVINTSYGGFSISEKVYKELGLEWDGYGFLCNDDLEISDGGLGVYQYRADPRLIEAIEKVGLEDSSSKYSRLKIIDVPEGLPVYISDYDGKESIHEKHTFWD